MRKHCFDQGRQVNFALGTDASAPGNGGGLHVTGAGRTQIVNSTVSGNFADLEGGGLCNFQPTTISGRVFEDSSQNDVRESTELYRNNRIVQLIDRDGKNWLTASISSLDFASPATSLNRSGRIRNASCTLIRSAAGCISRNRATCFAGIQPAAQPQVR